MPTPRTSDTNGPGVHGDGGMDLRTTVTLLPTPTASFPATTANFRPDGTPYREGYGPTLLDAARHLLPTPTATPYGNNQSPSPGAAVRPSLNSLASHLLPTPTAADGDRTSPTYGRGNPTLTGAVSPPPSVAGDTFSGDEPHGQLTIEIG
ncbi:hypothetical protein ACFV97_02560 [Streptomyces sp. NPDC059913]|uniref:hypothetical protein n=1 Tax=unclassified Streptomyces TaxID=2593676 RepID=UPI00364E1A55